MNQDRSQSLTGTKEPRQEPSPLQDLTDYNGTSWFAYSTSPMTSQGVCLVLLQPYYYNYSQKVPSKMFDRVLNTSVLIH